MRVIIKISRLKKFKVRRGYEDVKNDC